MAATASRVVQATATIGRALISTIEPVSGGVPRMTAFVADALRRQGWQVTLAWYAPYRRAPELSVPLYQLGSRRPSARRTTALDDYEGTALVPGCRSSSSRTTGRARIGAAWSRRPTFTCPSPAAASLPGPTS